MEPGRVVFKRQKEPPPIDEERFPWLAGAVAIADKIAEFREALIDFEDSWVRAADSQDEAELASALAKDDAQEVLENEALSMMKAWRDQWFPDTELRAIAALHRRLRCPDGDAHRGHARGRGLQPPASPARSRGPSNGWANSAGKGWGWRRQLGSSWTPSSAGAWMT